MGWFGRKRGYDRARIMRQAARARRRRKRAKALELYRQVLAKEPENTDVLRRVAALLAETKQPADSWATYRRAVAGLQKRGFVDQAVGVLREACASLPHETEVWTTLADFELERGRPIDAHKTLVQASHRFRGRRHRAQAILLLLRARKMDPHHFSANFELAGLLSSAGARERALRLLDDLARTARGGRLRKVRGRQLALQPTPAAAWRWVRAAFAGS